MNYEKIYNQIIERAKTRQLDCYKEKHHILPRCMGGLDEKENLAELTAREHFLCHRLLVEIYPKEYKLLWALWLMAIGKRKQKDKMVIPYKVSSREYERIRLIFIEKSKLKKITENHKKQVSKANSRKVYQYDFQGQLINEFPSAAEAERYINNKPNENWKNLKNNIDACCRLSQKSAYGYIWKYKEEILNLEEHKGALNKLNGERNKYINS
jgi:hypothetical protein